VSLMGRGDIGEVWWSWWRAMVPVEGVPIVVLVEVGGIGRRW
jgi:hypothetical protein